MTARYSSARTAARQIDVGIGLRLRLFERPALYSGYPRRLALPIFIEGDCPDSFPRALRNDIAPDDKVTDRPAMREVDARVTVQLQETNSQLPGDQR